MLLPAVRAEFRAGRIGVAQINELAKLAANPRVRDVLPASEQVLLRAAQELRFEDFKTVCGRWEQLADRDGAYRDHDRSFARRNATIIENGGEFELQSRQAAIQGTVMYRTILASAADERGWLVCRYSAKDVEAQAAAILGDRADDVLSGPRRRLGPPWTKDHRIALAATVVCG